MEEADDFSVLGIRGHPVPESRRKGWRVGFDDRMEPFAHGAIRFRHFGDLPKYGIVPWHILTTYKRLVQAFKEQNTESILHYSADLGHYVGDAHVPLHTTENYDGQFSNQKGIFLSALMTSLLWILTAKETAMGKALQPLEKLLKAWMW